MAIKKQLYKAIQFHEEKAGSLLFADMIFGSSLYPGFFPGMHCFPKTIAH